MEAVYITGFSGYLGEVNPCSFHINVLATEIFFCGYKPMFYLQKNKFWFKTGTIA